MNPKGPYAVGYAIERTIKQPVSVMHTPTTVQWGTDDVILAVMRTTDYPLRALIDMAVAHFHMYHRKQEKKNDRSRTPHAG